MNELISTALPYVNGPPHIGFAQELVITDALVRHARSHGVDVHFLSGTDENSLKNVLAAEAENLPTAEYVARGADVFQRLAQQLDVTFDDFIRTSTDPRHAPVVEAIWHACDAAGDIYQKDYTGLYCVGCEQFYRPEELTEGCCPEHLTRPEEVSETNYFFRLSRYQSQLVDAITSGRLEILPEHRRNEVLSFLSTPLADLSISRSRERAHGWGLQVPGDESQVIYVWFDALVNYLSARGFDAWRDAERVTHVIGKGVSRFHCVYWPAILLSAQQRLPDRIWIHGYVTVDGEKISKSLGGAIDPNDAVAARGTDALRYYLLRHVGSHRDADFSWARYGEVYDHELANQLGNLVSRTVALVNKTPGVAAASADGSTATQADDCLAAGLHERVTVALEVFAVHRAVEEIWRVVEATNAFISAREPWKLTGPDKVAVLAQVVRTLRRIGAELAPFLPDTANKLVQCLDACSDDTPAPPIQLFPKTV